MPSTNTVDRRATYVCHLPTSQTVGSSTSTIYQYRRRTGHLRMPSTNTVDRRTTYVCNLPTSQTDGPPTSAIYKHRRQTGHLCLTSTNTVDRRTTYVCHLSTPNTDEPSNTLENSSSYSKKVIKGKKLEANYSVTYDNSINRHIDTYPVYILLITSLVKE